MASAQWPLQPASSRVADGGSGGGRWRSHSGRRKAGGVRRPPLFGLTTVFLAWWAGVCEPPQGQQKTATTERRMRGYQKKPWSACGTTTSDVRWRRGDDGVLFWAWRAVGSATQVALGVILDFEQLADDQDAAHGSMPTVTRRVGVRSIANVRSTSAGVWLSGHAAPGYGRMSSPRGEAAGHGEQVPPRPHGKTVP